MKLFNLPVTSNHPCLSKLLSINSNSWQELPKKRIRVLNDSSVRIWTITKHRIAPVLTFICGFFTASRGATLKFCWESLDNRDWISYRFNLSATQLISRSVWTQKNHRRSHYLLSPVLQLNTPVSLLRHHRPLRRISSLQGIWPTIYNRKSFFPEKKEIGELRCF